jgi:hypothetical protein
MSALQSRHLYWHSGPIQNSLRSFCLSGYEHVAPSAGINRVNYLNLTLDSLSSTNLYRSAIINAYSFHASENLTSMVFNLLPERFGFDFVLVKQAMELGAVSFRHSGC